jgi:hypothetical protein
MEKNLLEADNARHLKMIDFDNNIKEISKELSKRSKSQTKLLSMLEGFRGNAMLLTADKILDHGTIYIGTSAEQSAVLYEYEKKSGEVDAVIGRCLATKKVVGNDFDFLLRFFEIVYYSCSLLLEMDANAKIQVRCMEMLSLHVS